jgi:hypothetical protein
MQEEDANGDSSAAGRMALGYDSDDDDGDHPSRPAARAADDEDDDFDVDTEMVKGKKKKFTEVGGKGLCVQEQRNEKEGKVEFFNVAFLFLVAKALGIKPGTVPLSDEEKDSEDEDEPETKPALPAVSHQRLLHALAPNARTQTSKYK